MRFFFFSKTKTSPPEEAPHSTRPLQLQAYERLVLLADRIGLPNLVSRLNDPAVDARQMQIVLIENLKYEFEYNTSQQIYVSQDAWDAVRKLKDQNMLIINQIAATLPANASALDLNRKILDYTMTNKTGSLHELVMEAVNQEAKRLMK